MSESAGMSQCMNEIKASTTTHQTENQWQPDGSDNFKCVHPVGAVLVGFFLNENPGKAVGRPTPQEDRTSILLNVPTAN